MKKYLILTVSLIAVYYCSKPPEKAVVFLDVGQGSAILIQNKTCQVLIDTGNYYKATHSIGKFLPKTDKVIDHLIISHFDSDHYAGIYNLLKRYSIPEVLVHHFSQIPSNLRSLPQLANIPSEFSYCGADFRLLWPSPAVFRSPVKNENSIVLDIDFNGFNILLTGDIGCHTESQLETARESYNIMQTAHHGSKYSNCLHTLQRFQPTYLVTQSGYRNRYRHPHPEVLQRVSLTDIQHLRTDQLSDIIFSFDGSTIQVSSSRTRSQTEILAQFLESRAL